MKLFMRLHGEGETYDIAEAKERGEYELLISSPSRFNINLVKDAVRKAMEFNETEIEMWEE